MQLFAQIQSPILSLTFSPDGRTLSATVRDWMRVGQWHLPAGTFKPWHPWADTWVRCIAYSPDGTMLAVGNAWGMVLPYFWPRHNYNSEYHTGGPVLALAYAPTKPVLAVAAAGVTLWTEGGNGPWDLPVGESWVCTTVAFGPDGKSLACCVLRTKMVRLSYLDGDWMTTEEALIQLPHTPRSAVFSPDGRTLTIAANRTVFLYDPKTGIQRAAWTDHQERIQQLAYNPSGTLLATASADGTVRLWHPNTGQVIRFYDWGIGPLRCLAFAPDGLTCAAGAESGQVVLWDVED